MTEATSWGFLPLSYRTSGKEVRTCKSKRKKELVDFYSFFPFFPLQPGRLSAENEKRREKQSRRKEGKKGRKACNRIKRQDIFLPPALRNPARKGRKFVEMPLQRHKLTVPDGFNKFDLENFSQVKTQSRSVLLLQPVNPGSDPPTVNLVEHGHGSETEQTEGLLCRRGMSVREEWDGAKRRRTVERSIGRGFVAEHRRDTEESYRKCSQ